MSITATAVWRVRISGNDANGAGYDASISGAGTDYSQQDAAQLSLTDIACSASTTVTSVTGGFTSAMIGNAIRITGGGATSGYYFITARTDTNTITVDRTPGTVSGGTGKVGGGAATLRRIWDNSNAAGDKIVAGNTIWVRGAGTDTPSSDDYVDTTYITCVQGTTDLYVHVFGENGRPRLKSTGLMFYTMALTCLRKFYLCASSNSNGSFGLIRSGGSNNIIDVVVDTSTQAGLIGIYDGGTSSYVDVEIKGGNTSPSSSSGDYGIFLASSSHLINCKIHHMRDTGVVCTDSDLGNEQIIGCQIYGNINHGIILRNYYSGAGYIVAGNTIDGNSGDGVRQNDPVPYTTFIDSIYNNTITNNGAYGINMNTNTTSRNDSVKHFVDYNNFYNNTSGSYHNISAGAHDLNVDPQYVDSANGDFTPQNTALIAAVPIP